jgi:hypothetical protein
MVEGYYLIFDAIVALALFVYVRTLWRVVSRRVAGYPRRPWYKNLFAIWREALVPTIVLTEVPRVLQEPWSYLVTGDVGAVAMTVSMLGLATVGGRISFYVLSRHVKDPGRARPTSMAG